MTADGKYELAISLLESAGDRFERSNSVELAALRFFYVQVLKRGWSLSRDVEHYLH
jgi:hypothetical protein